jgi:[CysO sulfur-carrier protein]-S-L-cysteine hydrolase
MVKTVTLKNRMKVSSDRLRPEEGIGNQMHNATITRASLDAIVAQAEREFPDECCGFIIGDGANEEVRPIANVQNQKHAENPAAFSRDARTAFLMDPQQHLAVLNEVDRRKLKLLAVYHSHPDHDAYFSATDRAAACLFDPAEPDYPETFHIVMSIRGAKFLRAAAFGWDSAAKDFVEIPLEIV